MSDEWGIQLADACHQFQPLALVALEFQVVLAGHFRLDVVAQAFQHGVGLVVIPVKAGGRLDMFQ